MVLAHLVAEATRAGVDRDREPPNLETARRPRSAVVDGVDALQLQEVVARAERTELTRAALEGARRDVRRIRPGHAAPLLLAVQILDAAEPLLDHPVGAARKQPLQVLAAHAQPRAAPHPRRHRPEQRLHQLLAPAAGREQVGREAGAQQPDAAGDVEADATG